MTSKPLLLAMLLQVKSMITKENFEKYKKTSYDNTVLVARARRLAARSSLNGALCSQASSFSEKFEQRERAFERRNSLKSFFCFF